MPSFDTVTVCAGLVVPTRREPNASVAALTTTLGCDGAVHEIDATLSPPASLSLVNVTVAVCVPISFVGGAQRIGTVLLAGAVIPLSVHVVCPAVQPLPVPNENHVSPCVIDALVAVSVPIFAAAVFETVMVDDAVVPHATFMKSTSVTPITAARPVPLRVTSFVGVSGSFVEIVSVALRTPTALGLNVTVKLVFAPGLTVAGMVRKGTPVDFVE